MAVHFKEKPHRCQQCSYSCASKGALDKHSAIVHGGIKPHQCLICAASFGQKGHLVKHVRNVHKIEQPEAVSTANGGGVMFSQQVFV